MPGTANHAFNMTVPKKKFPANHALTKVLYFFSLQINLVLLSFHPPSVVHWRARRVEGKVWN